MIINPLWAGAIAVTAISAISAVLEERHRRNMERSYRKFLKRIESKMDQRSEREDPLIMSPGWRDRLNR